MQILNTDTILPSVKMALRITTDDFNLELNDLIYAGAMDLVLAGIQTGADVLDCGDYLVKRAITTYCRYYFGQPDQADRIKATYDEQKAQLMTATGYTVWEG